MRNTQQFLTDFNRALL